MAGVLILIESKAWEGLEGLLGIGDGGLAFVVESLDKTKVPAGINGIIVSRRDFPTRPAE
jgi:hypothetical protein